jgi:hypothetical protein
LGRAQRILKPPAQTSAAGNATGAAAAAGTAAGVVGAIGVTQVRDAKLDDYYGEDEYEGEYADDFTVDHPAGRPRPYIRCPAPFPLVRDDDHVAKLKLNVPTFDGRYNPDAYLSWGIRIRPTFCMLKLSRG